MSVLAEQQCKMLHEVPLADALLSLQLQALPQLQ